MKVYSLTFSPTGTSGKIARAVADAIDNAHHCDMTIGDHAQLPDFTTDDIVVISAPVYGGHIAPVARRRFESLAAGNGAAAVVVALYGNRAFENAVTDLAMIARNCGFRVVAAGAFVGEHSYSTAANPIAAGRPDAADLDCAAEFGRSVARHLQAGILAEADPARLADLPNPPESVANFISFVTALRQNRSAGPVNLLPVIDEAKCSGCGACVDLCPVGTLTDDYRRADPALCIKCCACVKGCPEGARTLDSPFATVLSQNFKSRKSPLWIVGETSGS